MKQTKKVSKKDRVPMWGEADPFRSIANPNHRHASTNFERAMRWHATGVFRAFGPKGRMECMTKAEDCMDSAIRTSIFMWGA